jgi:hypothetical protein
MGIEKWIKEDEPRQINREIEVAMKKKERKG